MIGRCLQSLGFAWSIVAITVASILLSHGISLAILLARGNIQNYFEHDIFMATAVPALVAAPISFLFLRLYFELEAARRKIEEISRVDGLTGIFNRRYFNHAGESEVARAHASGSPLALAVLDLDHFKHINDLLGHVGGDEVLRQVVRRCHANLRTGDIFARLGGEEFAVLLPDTALPGALTIAERMREGLAADPLRPDGHAISVTISIGVAQLAGSDDFTSLLQEADRRLYRAKDSGRNRVNGGG